MTATSAKFQHFRTPLHALIISMALISSPMVNALSTDANSPPPAATMGVPHQPMNAPLNADDAVPDQADISSYINELESMKRNQREALEMKQELETMKLRAELMALRGGAQREGASPYIMALMGVSKNRQARIMVPGYGEMTVRKGNVLPGNWHIINVTNQTVIARQGDNEQVQLPFFAH